MLMTSRTSRRRPIRSRTMPSAEERFDQASDNTRAFLKGTVQECSSSEHVDRTELCRLYKDWCVFNRINPVSARRLYKSVWEIFRVKTQQQSASGPPVALRRCRSAPKGGRCGRCGRCAAGLKSPSCRRPQSWTASRSALSAALAAGAAGFSRTFRSGSSRLT